LAHTIVALMQDRPGVLNRVVSLFRRRGFNIQSLAVGPSETPDVSRMTLVVDAPDVEQVVKQLNRLIEVLKVADLTAEATVERETVLMKIHAPSVRYAEIGAVTGAFGARVADPGPGTMIVEMTGEPPQIDRFIEAMRPFGLKELIRTGRLAMLRGAQVNTAPGDPVEHTNGYAPA
jgi:acetolactate synthase-1/3 small subunit